ncbi:MAG TPA: hypothetical protein VFF04_03510 [Candidatus Babeliales bacterium]|nr:hypothetical protein [Candidatus Babeliales bacterium]
MIYQLLALALSVLSLQISAAEQISKLLVKSSEPTYNAAPHRFEAEVRPIPPTLMVKVGCYPTSDSDAIKILLRMPPEDRSAYACKRAREDANEEYYAATKAIDLEREKNPSSWPSYPLFSNIIDSMNLKWGVHSRTTHY